MRRTRREFKFKKIKKIKLNHASTTIAEIMFKFAEDAYMDGIGVVVGIVCTVLCTVNCNCTL